MFPSLETLNNIYQEKELSEKSWISRYLEPCIPVFVVLVPLYFATTEELSKINWSQYSTMLSGIIIPILVKDLICLFPTVFEKLKRVLCKVPMIEKIFRDGNTLHNICITSWGNPKLYSKMMRFVQRENLSMKSNKYSSFIERVQSGSVSGSKEEKYYGHIAFNIPYITKVINPLEMEFVFYIRSTTNNDNMIYIGGHDMKKLDKLIDYVEDERSLCSKKSSICKVHDTGPSYDKRPEIKKVRLNNYTLDKSVLSDADRKKLTIMLSNFTNEKYISKLSTLGFKNKLSILFHGVAGTGKSTLCLAIAEYLHRNVIFVDKANPWNFFDAIMKNIDLGKLVVVFDDIDFWQMDSRTEQSTVKIDGKESSTSLINMKLMKLMELLDGFDTTDSTVFLFTTNFPENFDKALFRAGRINLKMEITGLNCESMWRCFFSNIYGESNLTQYFIPEQLDKLYHKNFTISTVSAIAVNHLFSCENFITELKTLL